MTNDEVFDAVAREAVEAAAKGFNATILAYGQTVSGKTYTMGGGDGSYENIGIIPRALSMVFECMETPSEKLTRLKREIKKLRAGLKFLTSKKTGQIDICSRTEKKDNEGIKKKCMHGRRIE